MSATTEERGPAARIVRAREGRWLGGVCAGLPDLWGLGVNGRRLFFVLATLLGGLGLVVYLACWLVIPSCDQDPDADPVRSIVLLAWATGALVVLVLVAVAAAAATVFGLGWLIFAVATVIAALSLGPLRQRIPTVGLLLSLAALTLPAVAVALSPLRLTFQSGQAISRPKTFHALGETVYHTGLGTLLIDLRHTSFPSSGRATLRIDAGLKRTIVALPADSCVRVRVKYDVHLFPAHLATLLSGHSNTPFHDVMLFGTPYGEGARDGTRGTAVMRRGSGSSGPMLTIDFTSQGGGLYVRDYPDSVSAEQTPQWPGFPVTLEPHPNLSGEPRKLDAAIVADWRTRLKAERASRRFVESDMYGPCVGPTRTSYPAPVSASALGLAKRSDAGLMTAGGGT